MPALRPGYVYRHSRFYLDRLTGESKAKFLVVLAHAPGGDSIAGVLTSRPHGRPERPPCYHGNPYPGFYLGVLGGPLTTKSWVDLTLLRDLDDHDAAAARRRGILTESMALPEEPFRLLLACAAAANDTTVMQEGALRDHLAQLNG